MLEFLQLQKLWVTQGFFIVKVLSKFDFGQFLEKRLQRHLVTLHWIKNFRCGTNQYMLLVSKIGSKSVEEFVSRFCYVQISGEQWLSEVNLQNTLYINNTATCLNVKTGSNFDFNPLITETGLFRRHDFQNELLSKKVQVKKLSFPLPKKPYEVDYSDQLTTKEVRVTLK